MQRYCVTVYLRLLIWSCSSFSTLLYRIDNIGASPACEQDILCRIWKPLLKMLMQERLPHAKLYLCQAAPACAFAANPTTISGSRVSYIICDLVVVVVYDLKTQMSPDALLVCWSASILSAKVSSSSLAPPPLLTRLTLRSFRPLALYF